MKKKRSIYSRFLELRGMYDCSVGKPQRCQNESYLRGYGKQYELEAVISGRSLEIF